MEGGGGWNENFMAPFHFAGINFTTISRVLPFLSYFFTEKYEGDFLQVFLPAEKIRIYFWKKVMQQRQHNRKFCINFPRGKETEKRKQTFSGASNSYQIVFLNSTSGVKQGF